MTSLKYVLGVLVLALLAGMVFADELFPQESLKESQVIITPANTEGSILNLTVLVFEPATSTGGTDIRTVMEQIVQECASAANRMTCIEQKSLERTAASRDYTMNLTSLPNAHFVVEYFNPQGNAYRGQWTVIESCNDIVTDRVGVAYRPDPTTGAMIASNYNYVQCDIGPSVGQMSRAYIRATFVPLPDQQVSQSSAEYEYSNAHVTPATQFAQDLQNFISGVADAGGQGVGAGGALPCVGLFMIMGLLLASLYFSGKSPITLLDITTPRLPTPKGVTASGQILAPFGYTEMKKSATDKMRTAAAAVAASRDMLSGRMAGNSEHDNLQRDIRAQRGTAADRAVGSGAASVAQGQAIASSLVTAGMSLGMRGSELASLARTLPYHYGDAEHKLVAQILAGLEAAGGRQALMAMTIRDYFYGQATFKQLEVLTAHPEYGKRSAAHYRLTNTLGKFYGANRYAILSGVVMAGTDSMVRSGRILGRMTKAIATETPHLARTTARTTMEMVGGKHIVEELEARGRTSPTAAWAAGQLQKHPSEVVVGNMFPVNDRMSHLYKTLRTEALNDEMRYVVCQIYKKMGINFRMTEEELAMLGHKDVDILKVSGFSTLNAQQRESLLAAEAEIKRTLSNSTLSVQDRLSALMRVAETHGAVIDHQMVNFTRRLETIEASANPDHVKMILLQQVLEEQNRVKQAVSSGGMAKENAYVCHVGGDTLRGNQIWETMVGRTMVYDGANGHLNGGIAEELLGARLKIANRLAGLDPGAAGTMELLPEHMRNATELKKVSERNRQDLISLFTSEGKQEFAQYAGKRKLSTNIESASISQLVDFMYGGNLPRSGDVDKKTGRMTWWNADVELGLGKNLTKVDLKGRYTTNVDVREIASIGAWLEARMTRGNITYADATVEAQVKRLPGYASMTGEQEAQAMKKIAVTKALVEDLEVRFNSQFGHNAYGTTRESMKFYGSIMGGFLEKALEDKKLPNNHGDLMFVRGMDMSSPKDLSHFKDLLVKYDKEYKAVISKPMTYDAIAGSNKAIVLLQEGGYAYYKKGMILSDLDRVMAGQTALRDNKGQLRPFIPEDVAVTFGSRDDLSSQYHKARMSNDPNEWKPFMESVVKWAKEGGHYNYDKEKVLGAVLMEYGGKTHDYDSFWKHSAVTVEAKRNVTMVAPSVFRMFGVEAPELMKAASPFRNLGLASMDMVSKVGIKSAGAVLDTSYGIAAVGGAYSIHSNELTRRILSGQDADKLTAKEAAAYRDYAVTHGAFIQARQWTVDRSPFGYSTSHSTQGADAALFSHGPGLTFKKKDYIGAYMDKSTMMNFNALYGFPMDASRKVMSWFATPISAAQKEMSGRAGRWDTTGDSFRTLYHTEPRVRSAMQALLNPFSLSSGKLAEKLSGFTGKSRHSQVAGEEVMLGLSADTMDTMQTRKGVAVVGRYGDANPREKFYDVRNVQHLDAPMASELQKDSAFKYQQDINDAANNLTVRRTVSAESLAIKRLQEMMNFSSFQTPQGRFMTPVHFALIGLGIPNMISKHVAAAKHGQQTSIGGDMRRSVKGMSEGMSRLMKPGNMVWEVRCAHCGARGNRHQKCGSCGKTMI
jgi:hypothetical protein